MNRFVCLLVLLAAALMAGSLPAAGAPAPSEPEAFAPAYQPVNQSPELFAHEARSVYLTNLERRQAGLPPLRWNRELTLAARWFSWDSVENRDYQWIGHEDTLGGEMGDRARRFGYPGFAGAENAAWSSVLFTPDALIGLWMGSDGHRSNLLGSGFTEIGLGVYRQPTNGATYAAQMFADDPAFSPLIIENEAPAVTSPQVTLYQHAPAAPGGLTGLGPPEQVAFSDSACFGGAAWLPYDRAEYTYTLPPGEGWKTVYSRLRDSLGRTATASDAVYLGAGPPESTFHLDQLSRSSTAVTLYGLDGGGLSRAQFSLGWAVDDTDPTFTKHWGSGERVSDPDALGRTAYRMYGGGETMVWAYSYGFTPGDNEYIAYFRLKASIAGAPGQAARIKVESNGAGQERVIDGAEFTAAGQYQEFAYPFRYNSAADDKFIKFLVWRSGSAEITFDAVTVFTAPQPFSNVHTWSPPGGSYRGQGVWVRYSGENGLPFTPFTAAQTGPGLFASPAQIDLLAEAGRPSHEVVIQVSAGCAPGWSVLSKPAWLEYTVSGSTLRVRGQSGAPGRFEGSLVLQAGGETLSLPARLTVADDLAEVYLPTTIK